MKTVIMLHGLLASGKSTIAKQLADKIPNSIVLKSATRRPLRQDVSFFDENIGEIREQKSRELIIC